MIRIARSSGSAFIQFGLLLIPCLLEARSDVVSFGAEGNEFEVEFVEIGDPGNVADPVKLHGTGLGELLGGVEYIFEIGKYEVSRDIITRANESSDLALEMSSLSAVGNLPAVDVVSPSMPATGLLWWDIARFVNWLNQSSGYGEAYKLGDGSNRSIWVEGDAGYDASNPLRNRLAKFVLPSADEWHKAAYFDPDLDGGNGGYWAYPTQSDELPTSVKSGTEPGTAVFGNERSDGPAAVNEAGGLSAYGIMAMGGNAQEWEESAFLLIEDVSRPFPTRRGIRGGGWQFSGELLRSDNRQFGAIADQLQDSVGFRLVMLPDVAPLPLGDFSMDTHLSNDDIDLLSEQVAMEINTPRFDLNDDGLVDSADRTFWVEELAGTSFGDADLNGTVEFADFLALSANFNQETGWAGGDFDGNGVAEFADFLLLSDNFGKTRSAMASVPEPTGQRLAMLSCCLLLVVRRRRSS